jgi:hypothetical protein
MMITNARSGTNIHEIVDGIFRINTPIMMPGGSGQFNFNQYLIVDEAPLLFLTGLRRLFPLVRKAVAQVMPIKRLRYITISHFEADECGSLNEWLAAAPEAEPLCSRIGAMVSIGDIADRAPRSMTDGEVLTLGKHTVRWFDTPHMPHAWDCGMMMEGFTRTFLCGDLFTQGGSGKKPVVERISSGRAKFSARRWIIMRMLRIRRRSWSGQRCLPACTAARGGATERRCCWPWRRK